MDNRFTNFTTFCHFLFWCSAKVVGGYFQATVTVRCLDGDWKDAVFVGEVCRDKAQGRTDKLRLVLREKFVITQNYRPLPSFCANLDCMFLPLLQLRHSEGRRQELLFHIHTIVFLPWVDVTPDDR